MPSFELITSPMALLSLKAKDGRTIVPKDAAKVLAMCRTLRHAYELAPKDGSDTIIDTGVGYEELDAVVSFCMDPADVLRLELEHLSATVIAMDYLDCKDGLLAACIALMPSVALAVAGATDVDADQDSSPPPIPLGVLNRQIIDDVRSRMPEWWEFKRERKMGVMVGAVRLLLETPEFSNRFEMSYKSLISDGDRDAVIQILRDGINRRLDQVVKLYDAGRTDDADKAFLKVINTCRNGDMNVCVTYEDRCPLRETQFWVSWLGREIANQWVTYRCYGKADILGRFAAGAVEKTLSRNPDAALGIAWAVTSGM